MMTATRKIPPETALGFPPRRLLLLLRGIQGLGVDKIIVNSIGLVLRETPKFPLHGDPAKARQHPGRQDPGFQRPPPPPPPPRCREDARCGTRSCAPCAHAQARGARMPAWYPPQGGAHIAHGAALLAASCWPSHRLISGSTYGSSGSMLGRCVDAWARAIRFLHRSLRHEMQRRW
jgi:hypothetical protein